MTQEINWGDFLKERAQEHMGIYNTAFKLGEEKGYKEGFAAGVAEAQKIFNAHFPPKDAP